MEIAILAFAIFCACSAFKFNVHPDMAKSWAAMVTPYMEQCSAETNESVKEGYAGILSMNFPDSHKHECLVECIWRRWGFYDPKTNTFDYERIEDQILGFSKELTRQCVEQYKHIDDNCNKVYSIIKCGTAKLSKRY